MYGIGEWEIYACNWCGKQSLNPYRRYSMFGFKLIQRSGVKKLNNITLNYFHESDICTGSGEYRV